MLSQVSETWSRVTEALRPPKAAEPEQVADVPQADMCSTDLGA
jgi:hypothetical protein